MAKKETKKAVKETGMDLVISTEIKKFALSDAFFNKMKAKFSKLTIDGVDDKSGYENVRLALATTRSTKSSIENKRKEIKDDSLRFGRAVDSEAKRLQDKLTPIDQQLRDKKKSIDEEKDEIKEEKKAAKEKIVQDRSVKLMAIGMSFNGIKYEFLDEEISVLELTIYNDKNFNDLVERVGEKMLVKIESDREEQRLVDLAEDRMNSIREYTEFISKDDPYDYRTMTTDNFNDFLATLVNRSVAQQEIIEKEDQAKAVLMQLHEERMIKITPIMKYAREYINTEDICEWSPDSFNAVIIGLGANKIEDEEAEQKRKTEQIEINKQKEALAKEKKILDEKVKKEAEKKRKAIEKKESAALKPDKAKLKVLAEELGSIKYPVMKSMSGKIIIAEVKDRISDIVDVISSHIGEVIVGEKIKNLEVDAEHISPIKEGK